MKDTMKKIFGVALATACMSTVFTGCTPTQYKGDVLDGTYDKTATVYSNGGFAVEQGDYVYFINGKDSHDKSNVYGEVVKSALMRIKKSDLEQGKYDDVKTVVPSLFVSQNYNAGIYIYDGYVYYATPTTNKTLEGTVGNTHIDFKRAKLDGSEAPMKDAFFRLADSADTKYRFVQTEDGTVYCLYEEDGALKSYNTTKKESTVLVSGAESTFYYDVENAGSPVVYYTMNVKASLDGNNADYNQLYSVRADATVTATDKAKASYTVSNGYTYDFDEVTMKEKNAEAKKNGGKETYNFSDYTTYPYVNLGTLVLDGVGKSTTKTQYTHSTATPIETAGYKYTIQGYRDGGLYFTRSAVQKTDSPEENAKLYYVADATVTANTWDTVASNVETALEIVSLNTTNTASALFYQDGQKQYYLYCANEYIYRAGYDNATDTRIDDVQLTKKKIGSATLWTLDKTNGDLYYYVAKDASEGNGNTLSKIRYNGQDTDYNANLAKEEYQPVSMDYVDFNNSADWYMPEMLGNTLLYGNAQSFGETSYTYVYASKLGTVAEITKNNKKYEEVQKYIKKDAHKDVVQAVMQYYFRTGTTELYDAVIDEYSASQQKAIADFVALFGAGKDFENTLESNFIGLVGKLTEEDAEAIKVSFKDSLKSPEVTDEKKGLEAWVLWTIVGGAVALIVAGVVIALVIVSKNKKAKQAKEQAIVNAGKRKVDVKDDKSINVYEEETPVEETTVEEEAEEVEETPVEESVETVEETVEETAEKTEE